MHESDVENAALAWFEAQGWTTITGSDIAPGEPGAERTGYEQAGIPRVNIDRRERAVLNGTELAIAS